MSTTSPPATATLSLSHRINAATRPLHSRLNALILSLLPLALPPHTADPALYANGMARLVPVYETFEGVLRRVVLRVGGDGDDGSGDGGGEEEEEEEEEEHVVLGLRKLYIRQLERGGRLRGDVEKMFASSKRGRDMGVGDCDFLCTSYAAATTEMQKRSRLEAFTEHIRNKVPERPHLLLAYAWVLYMALFSGGRYIRGRLREAAGAGFWDRRGGLGDEGEEEDGVDGVDGWLGFWTFEGEEDGEDIKAEFKARFGSVEGMLTEGERDEVVREAVFIMHSMTEVVVEISEAVGTGAEVAAAGQPVDGERMDVKGNEELSMRWLLLKHVLPMGMVELIAAGARSAVSVGIAPSFWSASAK